MDVVQRLRADRLALRLDVDDLAAHHAVSPGGVRDVGDEHRDDPGVARPGPVQRDELEGQREKRVAGEDRDGLAEDLVIRERAAAIVVVVHGGQVIVDQRVRVDQLQRARRLHHLLRAAAHGLRAGDDEDRTQALAPCAHAVVHGAMQRGRCRRLGRQHALERFVDQRPARLHVALEVEGRHGSSSAGTVNGRVVAVPLSSLASTSMRRSASSR